nr:ribonuclease H-like domain-containing protein [Tanacetum cinerariifolium]
MVGEKTQENAWGSTWCKFVRSLSRYKDRLVANGSSQQLGADFDETFSLVVKAAIICTVFSLVVSRKRLIHQLDVKNAFLNGDLSETIYMHQPPGFIDSRYHHHVCLLQRSLYELKQAPRTWFQRFAGYATRVGFYHSRSVLLQIIDSLHSEFDMTDLGALNYFLVDTESKLGPEGVPVQDLTFAEAEYRRVANVVAKTAWLRNLLRELHSPLSTATLVYCDNVSVIYMSVNPVQHHRTKHIKIDIHFVRDMVTVGQ